MHKIFIRIGTIAAAIAIGLGAFATHALRDLVSDKAVATFDTATKYMLYHAFALILTGILYSQFKNGKIIWAGRLFTAGIILFSGSVLWIAKFQASVSPVPKWLGPVTPVGGLCFIIGWLLLCLASFRKAT